VKAIVTVGCAIGLAAFALFVAPQPAGAAGFAGTWSVAGALGNVRTNPVCTFRQAGSTLSGTCRGPNASGPAAGKVSGGQIAWQWRANAMNANATSGIATFKGVVGPDNVIRGSWTFSALRGAGTFTAIRA
jgi:hypothetical protein